MLSVAESVWARMLLPGIKQCIASRIEIGVISPLIGGQIEGDALAAALAAGREGKSGEEMAQASIEYIKSVAGQ